MESSGIQTQLEAAVSPEAPKTKGTAPGRKRLNEGQNKEVSAGSARTQSFAELLHSRRKGLSADAEAESNGSEPVVKERKRSRKPDGAQSSTLQEQSLAAGQQVLQAATMPTDAIASGSREGSTGKKAGFSKNSLQSAGVAYPNDRPFPATAQMTSGKPTERLTADVQAKTTRADVVTPSNPDVKTAQERVSVRGKSSAALQSPEFSRKDLLTPSDRSGLEGQEPAARRMAASSASQTAQTVTDARPATVQKKTVGPTKGAFAAAAAQAAQSVSSRQATAPQDNAAASAGAAMKSVKDSPLSEETVAATAKSAAISQKGALTAAEESTLKSIVRDNGEVPGRKAAVSQMRSYAHGEPLNSREGIGAVRSMTAKEGEVLDILSGGEQVKATEKLNNEKPLKVPPAPGLQRALEGEGKAAPFAATADGVKQEIAALTEGLPNKTAAAILLKRQETAGGTISEARDATGGIAMTGTPVQGRGIESPALLKAQAVISQVTEGAAQMLRSGSERVVMTLQPPQLGTLDLDVVVQDNRVQMVMLADNQEVKQILQSGMDDLRNALQDKGFQIDRLEVLVQNRPDDAGQGFWQEAGFGNGQSREKDGRSLRTDALPAASEAHAGRTARLADGRISIFA